MTDLTVTHFSSEWPKWLAPFTQFCAVVAGTIWVLVPKAGAWPLIVGLTPWVVRWVKTGRPVRLTGYEVPLMVFVATAGLSVWAAYDRDAAWGKFWLIAGAVLLFYALAGTEEGRPQRGSQLDIGSTTRSAALTHGWLLALFGAAVAVYFLATHDWDQYPVKVALFERAGRAIQSPLPPIPGRRIHPNVAGGVLAFVVPFAGAVAWTQLRGVAKGQTRAKGTASWPGLLVAGGLLVVILFALALASSRGAWLALLAALASGGLWILLQQIQLRRPSLPAGPVFGVLLLVLAAGLGAGLRAWPGLAVQALDALPGPLSLSRLDLYRNSLLLAMDYPFIGAGLDGYMMLYSTYTFLIHVGYVEYGHNLFLDVAIEQGIFALIALAMIWVLFAMRALRFADRAVRLHKATSRPWIDNLFAGTAALSLITILVHGMVDDAFYGSGALLLLFVPLAFALSTAEHSNSTHLATALIFVVLLAVIAAFPAWRSLAHSNLAAVRQSRSELAVYAWPEWSIQDEVRRSVDLSAAVTGFERALALNPGNPSANRRLGQIELSLGQYERARAHLAVAYRVIPWDNATRQLYGEALLTTGQVADGAALWHGVNNDQNQLGVRAFWYEYIGDEARLAQVKRGSEGALGRRSSGN